MTKEKPILFNADMVKAILDGRKTQTRRVVKSKHEITAIQHNINKYWIVDYGEISMIAGDTIVCPYGKVGDELWVRETFCEGAIVGGDSLPEENDPIFVEQDDCGRYVYREFCDNNDIGTEDVKWTPSIFMPRKASRIQLRIKNIRVERLNDISEHDCKWEGAFWVDGGEEQGGYCHDSSYDGAFDTAKDSFNHLWNSINKQNSWNDNPWVWVVEFERIKP